MNGIPSSARRWVDDGGALLRLFATITVITACAITVRPLGGSARGWALLILLVVNSAFMAMRFVPESILTPRRAFPLFIVGVLAATAIMALTPQSSALLFAFFLTGNAGYRLPTEQALFVAALSSVLGTIALTFHVDIGEVFAPWYVGALTGVSVLFGITNRSRAEALRSAQAAAEQAELAARSTARAETLAERGRIARDVHDVLAHSLAGINMQLEVADALLDEGELSQAQAATRRAQSLVREGLTEVQRTVRALREDALPLVDTLRDMLTSTTQHVTLEVAGEPRELGVRATQALVRCAQEALTNASKYAPGAPLLVTIAYEPNATTLEVVNGPATEPDRALAAPSSGMGLVGMRERVALSGGTVTAGPILDGPERGGWRVHVMIPE